MSESIHLWTDGSSSNKGGKFHGAWAFIALYEDYRLERFCGAYHGDTGKINFMELSAIYAGLSCIEPIGIPIVVHSDSNFSISCLTKWHKLWVANGWQNSIGKPVAHRPLVQAILSRMDEHRAAGGSVTFKHVKGHTGQVENERADHLAGNARKQGIYNLTGLFKIPGVHKPITRKADARDNNSKTSCSGRATAKAHPGAYTSDW